jgi:hypothetical protein
MKKVLLYLPTVVYAIAVIALNIILKTFSPLWYVWAVLLWLGGFLLNKGIVWGGLFGLLPAAHILYMSTQNSGQVISEALLGTITAIYVLICMCVVWRKGEAK